MTLNSQIRYTVSNIIMRLDNKNTENEKESVNRGKYGSQIFRD